MAEEKHDGAIWSSIAATGGQHFVQCWLKKAALLQNQRQTEGLATLGEAVKHAHEVARAHEYRTIYWLPKSHWRPGEIEDVH